MGDKILNKLDKVSPEFLSKLKELKILDSGVGLSLAKHTKEDST
jgi:hypothetical protein